MKRNQTPDPPWTPFVRDSVAEEAFDNMESIYVNSRYQVNVRAMDPQPPFGQILHLSIKRRDKQPLRKWRDLQKIKNEIVGPEYTGVEVFPPESLLVDTSNQYALWVFGDGYRLPFGFEGRGVLGPDPDSNSVQEPFEPEHLPPDLDSERNLQLQAEARRLERQVNEYHNYLRHGALFRRSL